MEKIKRILTRLLEVICTIIFLFILLIGTLSFYWLIHWIIFGRTFYTDLFNLSDKVKNNYTNYQTVNKPI